MIHDKGFSLIEIIITLVIVGIMAAVAGMGIVSMTQGYLFVKDNTEVAGKAQVALERITREVSELRTIRNPGTDAGDDFLVFDKVFGATAIGQVDGEILLATGDVGSNPDHQNGHVLTDQVSSLEFEYKKGDGNDWSSSDQMYELSHVVVTLEMSGSGNGNDFIFNTVIHPRNNGSVGGDPVNGGNGENGNGDCFVATAVYNSQSHYAVITLRQFRDRYLNTWPGGERLVNAYYNYGPQLAEVVQGRTLAAGLAKILIMPFVFVAFLLVYAQGAIPLALLIIAGGTWLAARLLRWLTSNQPAQEV